MQGSNIILPPIPNPASKRIALRVTPAAERALHQGHPWLFSNSITYQSLEGKPGDLAVIFDRQRKFIAIGLYDPTSVIRVRILQHRHPFPIDHDWMAEKIILAAEIRSELPENTSAYRLLNGENDGFPGLVIDRYAQSLVIKLYTPAWIPYLSMLITILCDLQNPIRIVIRLSRDMLRHPEFLFELRDGSVIYGTPSNHPVIFCENGITFEADLINGQKTGFFLDQRDNRARVEKLSQGKSVLNIFSYTGGFSVYAARGGAREVISVDISQPALAVAQRNFNHNRNNPAVANCHHEILAADAFDLLENYAQAKLSFDIVIVDPPSFAKRKSEVERALSAYQRLTSLGLRVLAPGGILVQASCSSRVTESEFFETIHKAALQNDRPLKEIERTGHPIDHPISFPEGKYLKCLFAFA